MALGDPLTDILNIVTGATGGVDRILVRSRYLPDFPLMKPGTGGEGTPTTVGGKAKQSLMRVLQPEIQLYLKDQTTPAATYAPYGAPGESQWPWMKFVLIFATVTVGYYTYKGVTRKR